MRSFRLFLYFLVGLLLGGYAVFSFAETVPASAPYWTQRFNPVLRYSSMQAACEAFCDFYSSSHTVLSCGTGSYGQGATCSNSSGVASGGHTEALSNYSTGGCVPNQGWTQNGTNCTRPDCEPGAERMSDGLCAAPCPSGTVRNATNPSICNPVCEGAQYLDEAQNKCVCNLTSGINKSYQVSEANAKAQNLEPPGCSNGCVQKRSGFTTFCPGSLATLVVGGSTTCYTEVFQTGQICSSAATGNGAPIQITLDPVNAPPADPGTSPSGSADPLATTGNNSDPIGCANSGGNWGVFNGKGNCYTPSASDPVSIQKQQQTVVNDPKTGESTTTTNNTTQTCTGIGSCTSTTTTSTSTTNGSGGTTQGSSTTTTGTGSNGSSNLTSTGNGNYKLDLPTDYQKDSTGLTANTHLKVISDAIGKLDGDDTKIKEATHSAESKTALSDADKAFTDYLNGQEPASITEKVSAWEAAMSEGWWSPIPITGCSPFSATIGSWNWTLDHCPTAAKISEIAAYCMWILLVFSGFRMLTTPKQVSGQW